MRMHYNACIDARMFTPFPKLQQHQLTPPPSASRGPGPEQVPIRMRLEWSNLDGSRSYVIKSQHLSSEIVNTSLGFSQESQEPAGHPRNPQVRNATAVADKQALDSRHIDVAMRILKAQYPMDNIITDAPLAIVPGRTVLIVDFEQKHHVLLSNIRQDLAQRWHIFDSFGPLGPDSHYAKDLRPLYKEIHKCEHPNKATFKFQVIQRYYLDSN